MLTRTLSSLQPQLMYTSFSQSTSQSPATLWTCPIGRAPEGWRSEEEETSDAMKRKKKNWWCLVICIRAFLHATALWFSLLFWLHEISVETPTAFDCPSSALYWPQTAMRCLAGEDEDRKWTSGAEIPVFLLWCHNEQPTLVLMSQHCPLLTSSSIHTFSRDIIWRNHCPSPRRRQWTRHDMGLKLWDLNQSYWNFYDQTAYSEAVSSNTCIYTCYMVS